MPKIITREYDRTTAGNINYSNFAVVVPGKVSENYNSDVFDTNGVYVCDTQADFKDNVGCVQEQIAAVAATVKNGAFDTVSADGFETHQAELYVPEEITDKAKQKAGRLVAQVEAEGNKWYSFTPATEYNSRTRYAQILAGDEGTDAVNLFGGNQYAYDLLGLGFQVVYVKIDAATDINDELFEPLKDRSNYDFRYVTTGGYETTDAFTAAANLATFVNSKDSVEHVESNTGRGDCVALIDIIEDDTITSKTKQSEVIKAIITKANSYSFADKYTAIFAPHISYNRAVSRTYAYDTEVLYPSSFNYLTCAAKSLETNPEWFAIAGYYRGTSPWAIKGTSLALGEIAVNALEPRLKTAISSKGLNGLLHSVNVTTRIRGEYYLWGNRTAHLLDDAGLVASHFLNIRQLCTSIKKQAYITCKKLTFNPNSDILWVDFCNSMRPLLDRMFGSEGIRGYKLVKVTDSRKALLRAKIKIAPIEAVEDFEISLYLEDSVTGITVGFEDSTTQD